MEVFSSIDLYGLTSISTQSHSQFNEVLWSNSGSWLMFEKKSRNFRMQSVSELVRWPNGDIFLTDLTLNSVSPVLPPLRCANPALNHYFLSNAKKHFPKHVMFNSVGKLWFNWVRHIGTELLLCFGFDHALLYHPFIADHVWATRWLRSQLFLLSYVCFLVRCKHAPETMSVQMCHKM